MIYGVNADRLRDQMEKFARQVSLYADSVVEGDSDLVDEMRYYIEQTTEGITADLEALRDQLENEEE